MLWRNTPERCHARWGVRTVWSASLCGLGVTCFFMVQPVMKPHKLDYLPTQISPSNSQGLGLQLYQMPPPQNQCQHSEGVH